jgi:hypothetical protein
VLPNLQAQSESEQRTDSIFRISPLIRITLMAFFLALTIPLPFLARVASAPIPPVLLWVGIGIGAIALYGALSERVIVDEEKIQVAYPRWVPSFFRRGWALPWNDVKELKMRTTGQPVVGKSLLTPHAGGWVCPISQVGRTAYWH